MAIKKQKGNPVVSWFRDQVWSKVAVAVLLAILAVLWKIYLVYDKLPETLSGIREDQNTETRLREGRDESLQRQQSKTAEELNALKIEAAKHGWNIKGE